jgi:hypothetical protein
MSQKARECVRAVDPIAATVQDQLAELDARTVANTLCNVAVHVMVEAGMTHADVADLLETVAHLSRHAGTMHEDGGKLSDGARAK